MSIQNRIDWTELTGNDLVTWLDSAEEIGYIKGYSKDECINRIDLISDFYNDEISTLYELRSLKLPRPRKDFTVFVQNKYDFVWILYKEYKNLSMLEWDIKEIKSKFHTAFMYFENVDKSVLMFGELDLDMNNIAKNCKI